MRTHPGMLAMVFHNTVRIIDSELVFSPKEEAAHQAVQFAKLVAATDAKLRKLPSSA